MSAVRTKAHAPRARLATVAGVMAAAVLGAWTTGGVAFAAGPPVSVRCVGDTISGQLTTAGPAITRLLAGHDAAHLSDTGLHHAVAGGTVSFAFDISGRSDRLYRVDAVDARGHELATTRPVNAGSCAPGTEVPEAPNAMLVPITLLATAGVVTAVLRRRGGAPTFATL